MRSYDIQIVFHSNFQRYVSPEAQSKHMLARAIALLLVNRKIPDNYLDSIQIWLVECANGKNVDLIHFFASPYRAFDFFSFVWLSVAHVGNTDSSTMKCILCLKSSKCKKQCKFTEKRENIQIMGARVCV